MLEMIDEEMFPAEIAEYEEKRAKRRFPIEQEVLYKTLGAQGIKKTGGGNTINISSRGVCFTTRNPLDVGVRVELSISWPVLLRDSCPIKLRVQGCVIRSSKECAALAIESYEFRTQGFRRPDHTLQVVGYPSRRQRE